MVDRLVFDHVLFNCKMKEYINKVSVCSTFNDISDHFPLILSCKKDDSEGFCAPTLSRRFKWSQHMCNEKHNEIFSSNYFSILLNEFNDNKELNSNEMVNKFIETANKVGDKVHARVPCDLKGSAALIISINFLMKSILHLMKSKIFL